jgi:UDP-N-acetylglucosamine:LPS N-acetylglucosamine transferase
MNLSNLNELTKTGRVLVAPLDWGLGHATRCIPVIKELSANGYQVIIAAHGAVKSLLQHEFPALTYISLPGYGIYYGRSKFWLPLAIAAQVPKMLFRIYKEHQWLKRAVKEYSIDAVIADNRFGLYHSSVPSIYITHQLQIKTGNRFSEKVLQKIHYWFINKYTACWVPDVAGAVNAAGDLSHPFLMPLHARYIGCISRFEKNNAVEKVYDLLVVISGPEPQRTILENILAEQLKVFEGSVMFVRGLPAETSTGEKKFEGIKNIVISNHLDAKALNLVVLQSRLVISRSGYTTVMDLIKLQQKAILVPTPGQTEQEYLAYNLYAQKIFYTVPQEKFSLETALAGANTFPFQFPQMDMELYKTAVSQFVQSL